MTYDELKAEADRQGYKLIRKTPYIRLSRCPQCGKFPKLWCGKDGWFYSCHQFITEPCKPEKQAKLRWNDKVDPDWRNR